ncbi:uncharacterized protein [Spinacia oleracea]|uniref:Aminotransferase-like plant mobile domain-containing protein n=1 Tax=Spinacia oleracea TaxID=3562 RepID=A0ABM3R523_SPIOL|nr:uncharacterized protein LOC130465959 [Spinacia oleracea]
MGQASRTALGSDPSMAALWSVLEIWIYEHFPTLASERTRDAAYPYAASWIGAVRVGASLAASRRAWRVLPADRVVWRPFANAVVPTSAACAHFLSGRRVLLPGVYRHMWYLGERVSLQHHPGDRLVPKDPLESMLALDEDLSRLYAEARGDAVCRSWREFVHKKGSYDEFLRRLAPPVRFVLPEEEVDPEDIPHADRILRYENSDGEEVVETIPLTSPPHRKSYDAVPEHYAPAPRVRVRRWMLLLDSWKRQCAKLTRKLAGRNREERRRDHGGSFDREPQVETSLRQEGPSLELGQGSCASPHQRHSDAERGASPFAHVDPTRHSFGGAGSSRPFVPPPGCYFGGSGPQPWGADSWAYWSEMDRMR